VTGPAEPRPGVGEASVGELVREVANDLTTLVRQEIALAKAETKEELTKAGKAGGAFGGAGLAGWVAVVFFSLALMFALGAAMPLLGGADRRGAVVGGRCGPGLLRPGQGSAGQPGSRANRRDGQGGRAMGAEQERIERDIMRQRMRLGDDVDALVEKVSPAQAARRQVGRVSHAAATVKERVMGQAAEATHGTHDRAVEAGNSLAERADQAKESVLSAKDSAAEVAGSSAETVRQRAQGNPLAAGLIAFGVGWLAASLFPASSAEERAGAALKDRAEGPVRSAGQQLGAKAKEVGEHLREPAAHAADSVKQSATDAAQEVKERAGDHAEHLTGEARERTENVRQAAQPS